MTGHKGTQRFWHWWYVTVKGNRIICAPETFRRKSLLSYAEKGCGKCHRCHCAEVGRFLFPTCSLNSGTILSWGDGWESLSGRAKFSTNFVTGCSLGSFIYRTTGTKLTGRINLLKCCCSAVPYSLQHFNQTSEVMALRGNWRLVTFRSFRV